MSVSRDLRSGALSAVGGQAGGAQVLSAGERGRGGRVAVSSAPGYRYVAMECLSRI